ncbi:PREDICTED: synaptonemal complex protein 2-like, partial [Thamnophis sirtalis]|uniref:Synaptonemal complex protein 2-like n=1 Tax=Thamnophis sirtalis TaxID=35019 RepID=A0A6I9XGV3_9SAUR
MGLDGESLKVDVHVLCITAHSEMLESLLSGAFKGKGFQKINLMIQEKDKHVPQKCKKQLLNQLDKALKKALRTLNTLLANITREEKKVFADSEEMCLLMKEFVKTIQDVGDYDIQVAFVEALFRMMLKKYRDEMVHSWFEDQYISKIFREIKDEDFETDSRKFLNNLNERLGDKRKIYSIPCKAAYAELTELKKPPEDKLEEFWIDFNYGSESITFYSHCLEDILWESVRLPKEDINNYYLRDQEGEKILIITMRRSVVINKAEITKIRIHFDSKFAVLAPLLKAIGKDKMMTMDEEENANQRQTATAASTNFSLSNTPVSIRPERKEDHTEIDSLSDILTSSQSNESVTPVIIKKIIIPEETVVNGENESQQLENEDGFQASSGRTLVSPSCSANTLAGPLSAKKLKPLRLQS